MNVTKEKMEKIKASMLSKCNKTLPDVLDDKVEIHVYVIIERGRS